MPFTADALTFAEVSKDPKGLEWLWSPQIVGLYNRLLQRCELNRHTTEAAAGALQNITAGDRRVRASPRSPARANGGVGALAPGVYCLLREGQQDNPTEGPVRSQALHWTAGEEPGRPEPRGGRLGGRGREKPALPQSPHSQQPPSPLQWAGVLSRLALEQERILNPLLDRVRTADHHQLRSLTGLIRNLSRNARNKDEMCESGGPGPALALPSGLPPWPRPSRLPGWCPASWSLVHRQVCPLAGGWV